MITRASATRRNPSTVTRSYRNESRYDSNAENARRPTRRRDADSVTFTRSTTTMASPRPHDGYVDHRHDGQTSSKTEGLALAHRRPDCPTRQPAWLAADDIGHRVVAREASATQPAHRESDDSCGDPVDASVRPSVRSTTATCRCDKVASRRVPHASRGDRLPAARRRVHSYLPVAAATLESTV